MKAKDTSGTQGVVTRVEEYKLNLTIAKKLKSLLEKKGYSKRFIAVECNGQIVPKTLYDSYEIQREDQIEIVQFVGGG